MTGTVYITVVAAPAASLGSASRAWRLPAFSIPRAMQCPHCQFVSKEDAPKFCSDCGQKLLPAAPAAGMTKTGKVDPCGWAVWQVYLPLQRGDHVQQQPVGWEEGPVGQLIPQQIAPDPLTDLRPLLHPHVQFPEDPAAYTHLTSFIGQHGCLFPGFAPFPTEALVSPLRLLPGPPLHFLAVCAAGRLPTTHRRLLSCSRKRGASGLIYWFPQAAGAGRKSDCPAQGVRLLSCRHGTGGPEQVAGGEPMGPHPWSLRLCLGGVLVEQDGPGWWHRGGGFIGSVPGPGVSWRRLNSSKHRKALPQPLPPNGRSAEAWRAAEPLIPAPPRGSEGGARQLLEGCSGGGQQGGTGWRCRAEDCSLEKSPARFPTLPPAGGVQVVWALEWGPALPCQPVSPAPAHESRRSPRARWWPTGAERRCEVALAWWYLRNMARHGDREPPRGLSANPTSLLSRRCPGLLDSVQAEGLLSCPAALGSPSGPPGPRGGSWPGRPRVGCLRLEEKPVQDLRPGPGTPRWPWRAPPGPCARPLGGPSLQSPLSRASAVPADSSSQAPADSSSQAPADNSSEAPADRSSEAPAESSSEAPAESSSKGPGDSSSKGPADSSSKGPADSSSQAPADSSTKGPADSSPEAPAESSSQAPADSSSKGPADSSSKGPADSSPEAPADSNSEAPVDSSSEAPAAPEADMERARELKEDGCTSLPPGPDEPLEGPDDAEGSWTVHRVSGQPWGLWGSCLGQRPPAVPVPPCRHPRSVSCRTAQCCPGLCCRPGSRPLGSSGSSSPGWAPRSAAASHMRGLRGVRRVQMCDRVPALGPPMPETKLGALDVQDSAPQRAGHCGSQLLCCWWCWTAGSGHQLLVVTGHGTGHQSECRAALASGVGHQRWRQKHQPSRPRGVAGLLQQQLRGTVPCKGPVVLPEGQKARGVSWRGIAEWLRRLSARCWPLSWSRSFRGRESADSAHRGFGGDKLDSKKRRKMKNQQASREQESLTPSCSCSLDSLVGQDPALPQNRAQRGGPPSQPPATGQTPLEGQASGGAGTVMAMELGSSPAPLGHAKEPEGSPAPLGQTLGSAVREGKDHATPGHSEGQGLAQEEASGSVSAGEGRPGGRAAAQDLPLPKSQGGDSAPRKEPQTARAQAGSPSPGVSCWGVDQAAPRCASLLCSHLSGKVSSGTGLGGGCEGPLGLQLLPAVGAAPAGPVPEAEKGRKNKTQTTKQPLASGPAPQESQQETKSKDEGHVSGEKAGGKEKPKPEAPERAEGSHVAQPVAVKKEKERGNQKAATQDIRQSSLSPEQGVTVRFYAILSKHFDFDPTCHKVVVRGGEAFGEPKWNLDVCEMFCTRDLGDNGFLLEGSTVLARQYLDKSIPYKYVVLGIPDSGEYEFEFIYKVQKAHEHVNRCLCMRKRLMHEGVWHQYDDIICRRVTGKIQQIIDSVTSKRKEVVRGKQIAATVMLDRIFQTLQPWNAGNIQSFFTRFWQFYAQVRVPMVYEGRPQPWTTLNYKEEEVKAYLWGYLKGKMQSFLNKNGDPLPKDFPVRSPLRMGLIVLALLDTLSLSLAEGDLSALCHLLSPSAVAPDALREDLAVLGTLDRWQERLVHFCLCCMEKRMDLWVCVLPVLHLCAQPPPPGKDAALQPEDAWAALEGIPYSEFRDKRQELKLLLQLMRKKRHLLGLDGALFRSWFSLLPLGGLVPYMEEAREPPSLFPARVPDCLLGTYYRLSCLREVTQSNHETLERMLRMLLSLLGDYQDRGVPGAVLPRGVQQRPRGPWRAAAPRPASRAAPVSVPTLRSVLEASLGQTFLTLCQKFHGAVCRITQDPKWHELPALSAELMCRIAALKPPAEPAAGSEDGAGQESVAKAIFQDTLATTRAWLRKVFHKRMVQSVYSGAVRFSHSEEIKIWKRLVEVDVPAELGWKEALLGDMEGRLKQEPPHNQIALFCHVCRHTPSLGDSMSKCFEKCAIEAVSTVCQAQGSVLEGLTAHNLKHFGTLLSAVVTQAWPRRDGAAVDAEEEVLKHLLTGVDIEHVFRLCGTGEKVLAGITKEARRLLDVANSVFSKAVGDLRSGAVLVGQLELIKEHKDKFLAIWEIKRKSLLCQEGQWKMEQVLAMRTSELSFLRTEQRCVDSLLKTCGKVQDVIEVDLGDVENRHLEDLSGQSLSAIMEVGGPAAPSETQCTRHYGLSPELRTMAGHLYGFRDSHVFQALWRNEAVDLGSLEDESSRPVLSLEEVFADLYSPCLRSFEDTYKALKSGEVTMKTVDDIFRDFVDKYDDLACELRLMCSLDPQDRGDWVSERVQQIRAYQHLHLAAHSAKVILKVRENLGLSGNFNVLQTLLNFTENFREFCHEKLDQISQQLIKAGKLLKGISGARYQCLEELARSQEFICWVREALGGITELKVFVDLASISAGENDIDVDRVACFHDAVQAYAPLLYELPATAGFREFMERLQELWKALENDQHLPSKLRDSSRNLEWLQTVRESHGSVELSSLTLAAAINTRGVYEIRPPPRGQKISPDAVLQLLLPESRGAGAEARSYSLEELRELLHKLMLMSSKKERGNMEVEAFSEVFCGVQSLVQAFIDLYLAGNALFRTWAARVHCSAQEGSVVLDFHVGPVRQLRGGGPVADLLKGVCSELEAYLKRWQSTVAQARAKHLYLNYYTAEQLVYLSTELGAEVPSDDALTMLCFLKGGCTARDVADARRAATGLAPRQLRRELGDLPALVAAEPGLAGQLRVLLERSVQSMGAFLPHCLDLNSLGCCLACLAEASGPPVERRLPEGLQAGQPNLVVCPQAEVLSSALALYMQSPGQSLPSYDEVLLCGPATTLEEVELLLHRCLAPGARGRRLHSLLFADRLSYEVGCRVEALLRDLCSWPHREDFQLVLVCASEREHCCLPSAFSRHKALVTPQQPLEAVRAYLLHHFQGPVQGPAAAAVFRDKACVGLVASERAGVGKSLYVRRLHEKLSRRLNTQVPLKVIRLTDRQVDEQQVLAALLSSLGGRYQRRPVIFHLDVTSAVRAGVPEFLFKLLVLQHLMDVNGKMWLRNPLHLYVVEILEGPAAVPARAARAARQNARAAPFSLLDVFPKVTCRPPKEVIGLGLGPKQDCEDPGMDMQEFCSETFQRPYQYLKRSFQKQNLDGFQYKEGSVEGTPEECLQLLLIHCGVANPSWAELRNFASFLNYQLRDCEASLFCQVSATGDVLQGFKNFVVTFMIFMARDFATPTLHMSDQSPGQPAASLQGVSEDDLAPFLLRKRWESEPHPYVFFNNDHTTMTFIGFHLQHNQEGGVDAVDPRNGQVIKRHVMTAGLWQALRWQRVPFNVNFDELPRHEKLERLCLALGVQWPFDPDDTYELTTDNMLKILAIEMRFRCGIPVVIMGETGCGKTRLIQFLSGLRRSTADTETLKLVKVHGGTTADMIYAKVREAQKLALCNKAQHQLDTILFLDEANTTEAISCIKEVLCDRTVDGESLDADSGLHIVAACNPYRKHSQEMISRLEAAGLGYRVRAEDTADRLGAIPLRQLVYRVHALPPSLVPLVWDFGQLNDAVEKRYIQQIVQRLVGPLGLAPDRVRVVTEVLAASQGFMRESQDECSFVSLRDVERCTRVFSWFYGHSPMLLEQLRAFLDAEGICRPEPDPALWSLVLAVGVCYHASMEDKQSYLEAVCAFFPAPFDDSQAILEEITWVQDMFLEGVCLRKAIAKNLALKENVFMMVICIELKIPLFLVGKPGSSKSLAKTIVADAMQGPAAPSELFRHLKQVHLVSFQCSPHSTPQGIIGTFRQCARFQQGKDLRQYVSVVVLDEVGLAEDSPKMPLKTLHPLLEDGCIEDDPAPHKKVGFVGISNWALDPAKMNRGLFVSRGSPDQKELVESARGICSSEPLVQKRVQGYFGPFARAYEAVCRRQDKEFFGLRDYYSLIKMVFAAARESNREPRPQDVAWAVLRNFSGKDDVHALDIFAEHLPEARCLAPVGPMQLIEQNLLGHQRAAAGGDPDGAESRYLLVLTRNYVALQILQQRLFGEGQQPEIIFGSSFPRDQEYTQICRNINQVKVCMETGRTVVLLNLQSLYESLYDALNQYYVYLGGQKYVDLGLGTHRVKCRVHPAFRLVVIEEKDVVYQHFPVPLINRLEKHYLDIDTVLEPGHRDVVAKLWHWVERFVAVEAGPFQAGPKYGPADVFVGFHADACASVVLQVAKRVGCSAPDGQLTSALLEEAKLVLLDCATPDAVVRLRSCAVDGFSAHALARTYYEEQQHDSFADFLGAQLRATEPGQHAIFTEVTTFSRLLTSQDREALDAAVMGRALRPVILSLQQFDTELSFLKDVRSCLTCGAGAKVLIVQTDFEDGAHSAQLVASAKYSAINEVSKLPEGGDCVFVYFIVKLPRMGSGTGYVGFHGGLWRAVHIDDLRRSAVMDSDVTRLQDAAISQLFEPQEAPAQEEEKMETECAEAPGQGKRQVLDTTSLLRSCIQGAVGLLRDQREGAQRSVRRVELLLGLLNEDSPVAAAFLRVVKMRLQGLLQRQEEPQLRHMREWVVRAAWSQDALQEAGTFRHTLWQRVQAAVTPLLASLVATVDRDDNLELLVRPGSPRWVEPLWMLMFGDAKLLDIPLVANAPRPRGEASPIMVQSFMSRPQHVSGDVPFSWRIKDYLEELSVQAQYTTSPEGLPSKLVEIFQQTPLGGFLAQLPEQEQQEILECYIKDFLLLTLHVSSREELRFLQMALESCIREMGAEGPEEGLVLPWVHLAYRRFRSRLHNFLRILTVHPQVLRRLEEGVHKHPAAGREMALDAFAAVACVEMLTTDLLNPSPQEWLRAVRTLSVPLELLCSDAYAGAGGPFTRKVVEEVRVQWNRVFSISLFVEHVLLGTLGHIPELEQLVTRHVSLLSKCLQEDSDIKTHRPFVAVMTVLRDCKDKASKVLSRCGVRPCPVCLVDAQDPVCLPCDHVFCLRCVRERLTPGQMMCPSCLTVLPEGFSPKPCHEQRVAIKKHARFRQLCDSFFLDLVSAVCFKDSTPPHSDVVRDLLALLFAQKELVRDAPQRHREHTKCLSPFDDVVDQSPVIRSVVLKLLLKYSFHEVREYIQGYLSMLEEKAFVVEDKTDLYVLFSNCLEDSLHEKMSALSSSDQRSVLQEDTHFLTTCVPVQGSLEAKLAEEQQLYLRQVERFCARARNDWFKVYLVRKLSSQQGMEFVQQLCREGSPARWVFPQEVLEQQKDYPNQMDCYLVYGEEYKTVREAVGQTVLKCQPAEAALEAGGRAAREERLVARHRWAPAGPTALRALSRAPAETLEPPLLPVPLQSPAGARLLPRLRRKEGGAYCQALKEPCLGVLFTSHCARERGAELPGPAAPRPTTPPCSGPPQLPCAQWGSDFSQRSPGQSALSYCGDVPISRSQRCLAGAELWARAHGGTKPQQAVHLLLALYREVSTLYSCPNASLRPKPESGGVGAGRGVGLHLHAGSPGNPPLGLATAARVHRGVWGEVVWAASRLWHLWAHAASRGQCEAVSKLIDEGRSLPSPNAQHFAKSLVTNTLPLLQMGLGHAGLGGTLTELAVHTAAVLLCGQGALLQPLQGLAFSPASMQGQPDACPLTPAAFVPGPSASDDGASPCCFPFLLPARVGLPAEALLSMRSCPPSRSAFVFPQRSFLPTMPEDLLAQARTWGGLEGVWWYSKCCCPQGRVPLERTGHTGVGLHVPPPWPWPSAPGWSEPLLFTLAQGPSEAGQGPLATRPGGVGLLLRTGPGDSSHAVGSCCAGPGSLLGRPGCVLRGDRGRAVAVLRSLGASPTRVSFPLSAGCPNGHPCTVGEGAQVLASCARPFLRGCPGPWAGCAAPWLCSSLPCAGVPASSAWDGPADGRSPSAALRAQLGCETQVLLGWVRPRPAWAPARGQSQRPLDRDPQGQHCAARLSLASGRGPRLLGLLGPGPRSVKGTCGGEGWSGVYSVCLRWLPPIVPGPGPSSCPTPAPARPRGCGRPGLRPRALDSALLPRSELAGSRAHAHDFVLERAVAWGRTSSAWERTRRGRGGRTSRVCRKVRTELISPFKRNGSTCASSPATRGAGPSGGPLAEPALCPQCGRPMERSKCVDCGADIGGAQHIPSAGFQVIECPRSWPASGLGRGFSPSRPAGTGHRARCRRLWAASRPPGRPGPRRPTVWPVFWHWLTRSLGLPMGLWTQLAELALASTPPHVRFVRGAVSPAGAQLPLLSNVREARPAPSMREGGVEPAPASLALEAEGVGCPRTAGLSPEPGCAVAVGSGSPSHAPLGLGVSALGQPLGPVSSVGKEQGAPLTSRAPGPAAPGPAAPSLCVCGGSGILTGLTRGSEQTPPGLGSCQRLAGAAAPSASAPRLRPHLLDNVDRTQTGHVLGPPPERGTAVACDRGRSPLAMLLLRLLTHLAMLLGAAHSPKVRAHAGPRGGRVQAPAPLGSRGARKPLGITAQCGTPASKAGAATDGQVQSLRPGQRGLGLGSPCSLVVASGRGIPGCWRRCCPLPGPVRRGPWRPAPAGLLPPRGLCGAASMACTDQSSVLALQALRNIIQPRVADPRSFLQLHIQRNLEQLTTMLAKSADEAASVVHLVLRGLLSSQSEGRGRRGMGGAGVAWAGLPGSGLLPGPQKRAPFPLRSTTVDQRGEEQVGKAGRETSPTRAEGEQERVMLAPCGGCVRGFAECGGCRGRPVQAKRAGPPSPPGPKNLWRRNRLVRVSFCREKQNPAVEERAGGDKKAKGTGLGPPHPQPPWPHPAPPTPASSRPDPPRPDRAFLSPQHLDNSLQTVHRLISQDERISSNPVAKLVFRDPAAFLPQLPRGGPLHCSRAWRCRRRVTVEHLRHVLEQRHGEDSVPVLWQFLQEVRCWASGTPASAERVRAPGQDEGGGRAPSAGRPEAVLGLSGNLPSPEGRVLPLPSERALPPRYVHSLAARKWGLLRARDTWLSGSSPCALGRAGARGQLEVLGAPAGQREGGSWRVASIITLVGGLRAHAWLHWTPGHLSGVRPVPFSSQEAELRLVKFLPEILALQRNLVKRFQNVPEVQYTSLRDFIDSQPSGGQAHGGRVVRALGRQPSALPGASTRFLGTRSEEWARGDTGAVRWLCGCGLVWWGLPWLLPGALSAEGLRQQYHDRISIFLDTWNQLRRSLETRGERPTRALARPLRASGLSVRPWLLPGAEGGRRSQPPAPLTLCMQQHRDSGHGRVGTGGAAEGPWGVPGPARSAREPKLPEGYCSADLDLHAPFEVVLPRRRGEGLCATALVSYLMRLHNRMVDTVGKFCPEDCRWARAAELGLRRAPRAAGPAGTDRRTRPCPAHLPGCSPAPGRGPCSDCAWRPGPLQARVPATYSVDAPDVTDLHVISYEVERDLAPLISANCQYQVVQGRETEQDFDLEKIQRQVISRFLQGKPRLTLEPHVHPTPCPSGAASRALGAVTGIGGTAEGIPGPACRAAPPSAPVAAQPSRAPPACCGSDTTWTKPAPPGTSGLGGAPPPPRREARCPLCPHAGGPPPASACCQTVAVRPRGRCGPGAAVPGRPGGTGLRASAGMAASSAGPVISAQGIPTLVSRRDWNYEHLFADIRSKVEQVSPGPSALAQPALAPAPVVSIRVRPPAQRRSCGASSPRQVSSFPVEGEQADVATAMTPWSWALTRGPEHAVPVCTRVRARGRREARERLSLQPCCFGSQAPLPRAVASAVGGQLQSYSDACEALSALEVALKFLSTGGGPADMTLNTYVQDMLRMEEQTALVLTVGLCPGRACLPCPLRCRGPRGAQAGRPRSGRDGRGQHRSAGACGARAAGLSVPGQLHACMWAPGLSRLLGGAGGDGWAEPVPRSPLSPGPGQVSAPPRRRPLAVPVRTQVGAAATPEESECASALGGAGTPGPAAGHLPDAFQEPFGEISTDYKDKLSPENTKRLRVFLNQTDLDAFLLELHELMVLKLQSPQAQDFNPSWRRLLFACGVRRELTDFPGSPPAPLLFPLPSVLRPARAQVSVASSSAGTSGRAQQPLPQE
ncbi:LOW QUALITY PROTEIN: E3 ubiquitin-protein ligase RNF213 [Galemys pyrenaicus]|uniref:E3 ubiquitin-protein ligase RNF213 n=1 Tax=Galemys pyrenaicus TaxID=202257 RepID=A0A8J5ZV76_GALPY|nr:LOW QUALITY PROTEIN: E3 ubiquitin-protein ligase RNF213 [Galemys pyrenaicus]